MIVDCESCPGQHLAPPACPSCVVRLLLDQPSQRDSGRGAPAGPARSPVPPLGADARPVAVDLVRTEDDLGAPLDARERKAVAVLTACGLLAGAGSPGGRTRRPRIRTRTA